MPSSDWSSEKYEASYFLGRVFIALNPLVDCKLGALGGVDDTPAVGGAFGWRLSGPFQENFDGHVFAEGLCLVRPAQFNTLEDGVRHLKFANDRGVWVAEPAFDSTQVGGKHRHRGAEGGVDQHDLLEEGQRLSKRCGCVVYQLRTAGLRVRSRTTWLIWRFDNSAATTQRAGSRSRIATT